MRKAPNGSGLFLCVCFDSAKASQAICYNGPMILKSRFSITRIFLAVLALSVLWCSAAQAGSFKVARINGSVPATLKSYVHWAKVASLTQGGSNPGVVAVPPRYGSCVRTLHKKGYSWKKAWSECRSQFAAYNENVMSLLITSSWILGEAKERNLSVTAAQVNAKFNQTKKAAFPTEKAFREFLRSSGESVGDIKGRLKVDLLSDKIRADVTKGLNDSQAQDALTRFVRAFQSKWKSRTTCNRSFAVDICGHRAK